jgi:ribonucleoside-triphosphate reductase
MNIGGLQSISINLPRIAYLSSGNDDKALELLGVQMDLSKDILLLKHKLIENLLTKARLPLCNELIDGQPLLDLRRQALLFGYVGLDEMVKAHTHYHLHEDDTAMEFGLKIARFLVSKSREFTKENHHFFTVWEEPAEFAAHRFALLDLTHFPEPAKSIINGNLETESVYYTPSSHTNCSIDISLTKRNEIHSKTSKIVQNNTALPIWLSDSPRNEKSDRLKSTTLSLIKQGVNAFSYNFDFFSCPKCGYFKKSPPSETNDHVIKQISKITNYYAPLELWNRGKKQEYKDRKRITL